MAGHKQLGEFLKKRWPWVAWARADLVLSTQNISLGPSTYCRSDTLNKTRFSSAADAKIEIPLLIKLLKSSFLSSTSFQSEKPSREWWVMLLSNQGVNPTWLLKETGNLALRLTTESLQKKIISILTMGLCILQFHMNDSIKIYVGFFSRQSATLPSCGPRGREWFFWTDPLVWGGKIWDHNLYHPSKHWF